MWRDAASLISSANTRPATTATLIDGRAPRETLGEQWDGTGEGPHPFG
jgi:hypothetical protein